MGGEEVESGRAAIGAHRALWPAPGPARVPAAAAATRAAREETDRIEGRRDEEGACARARSSENGK